MQIQYSDISRFWDDVCFGGNPKFPFKAFKDWQVLEIGCGGGVDATSFVDAGARYTGIDVSPEAVKYTNYRVGEKALVMNGENLAFTDEYFELVYSFGVIHHAVNPEKVVSEIYRVLKPGGFFFCMLYNKFSWRYLVEIKILRRILWFLDYHKFREIKRTIPRPTKQQWVSLNTDGIGCPLARAYTKKDVEKLLKDFKITNTWTENWGWFRLTIAKK